MKRSRGLAAPLRRTLAVAILGALGANAAAQDELPAELPADAMALADAGTRLERVEVEGDAQAKFKPTTTNAGMKIDVPLRDVPQAVTVVPRAVIESQGVTSLGEALRNVAGLTLASGEGGFTGDSITLRGFAARTDQYVDGVRDNGQYVRDIFNIERVEVLKGASSMLYGRGGTGGIVNSVTKKPTGEALRVVNLTLGSEEFKRATADIDQPLGENAAGRLNLMWQDNDSFRDTVYTERWAIAPSFTLDVGDDTRVDAQAYRLEHDGILDYGLPFNLATGRPVDVPHDLNYGAGDQSIYQIEVSELRVGLEHEFGNGASLRNTTVAGDYDRLYRMVRPNNINAPALSESILVSRNHTLRGGDQDNLYNVTDLTFEHGTGALRHQWLAGLELGTEEFSTRDLAGLPALPNVPLFDPQSVVLPVLPDSLDGALAAHTEVETDTRAVYVQDRIELDDRWSVVGGVRHDQFDADVANELTGVVLRRDDDMTSWRLGTVFQPDDSQSWYASWSTSFNPSAETFALNPGTAAVEPEENRNLEVGAKLTPWDERIAINVALFRLDKTNARTVDPSNTTLTVLDGRQRTDGIELEVQGALTHRWDVFAGVAFMDPEITSSNDVNSGVPIEGNRPANAPEIAANLWTVYSLGGGWEIGGGAFHVGERFGNTGNTLSIPSYTRWDGYIGYNHKALRIAINAYNLTDKGYFEYATGNFATPAAPRSVRFNVTYAF